MDNEELYEQAGLTEKQADAVRLRMRGDYTQRDIAAFLGITLKAAQDRLKYGIRKLKANGH